MSWLKTLNPFAKKDAEAPALAPEMAAELKAQGGMSAFFRRWKDPAFLRQMRALGLHMQKEGVDIKDAAQVRAWLEKNKARVEAGEFQEEPAAAKGETFVRAEPSVGRNEPCHCGSGKKFKKCHGR